MFQSSSFRNRFWRKSVLDNSKVYSLYPQSILSNKLTEFSNNISSHPNNGVVKRVGKEQKGLTIRNSILFLAWESPWPALGGAHLRALGLLKEISKVYNVDLLILSHNPLRKEQMSYLQNLVQKVIHVSMRDASFYDRLSIIGCMIRHKLPYHAAVIEHSLAIHPEIQEYIHNYPGVVFTDRGHWVTLIRKRQATNWILNQCDADVDFWRVYASQTRKFIAKIGAVVNWHLSNKLFPSIYTKVGNVISVCEEDRNLTTSLAPQSKVNIIENGVDCTYYIPHSAPSNPSPVLLFTGSSAPRNVTALHKFVKEVFPLIQKEVPEVKLLVAGNFRLGAQAEFQGISGICFTGYVEDIRPYFDQGDVYIAYFEETHGSKLKIAEAMAMAKAIVATPQGVRGFSLVDGQSVLLAHGPQHFADQVLSLLQDKERRVALGNQARKVALATIDWDVLGKRLVRVIDALYLGSPNSQCP